MSSIVSFPVSLIQLFVSACLSESLFICSPTDISLHRQRTTLKTYKPVRYKNWLSHLLKLCIITQLPGFLREAAKNLLKILMGPATKALTPPPPRAKWLYFLGDFFRASKKVIFS